MVSFQEEAEVGSLLVEVEEITKQVGRNVRVMASAQWEEKPKAVVWAAIPGGAALTALQVKRSPEKRAHRDRRGTESFTL